MSKITKEQKILVEENHGLIYSFLHKYGLPKDEYYDLAAIGLCRAAITYDITKANFSTYAYKCMLTYVLCEIKKLNTLKRIPQHLLLSYQDNINNDDDDDHCFELFIPSNEDVEKEALLKISLADYIDKSSQRDKKIIRLLAQGYSHEVISRKIGCCRSLVSMIKMKLINYLREIHI